MADGNAGGQQRAALLHADTSIVASLFRRRPAHNGASSTTPTQDLLPDSAAGDETLRTRVPEAFRRAARRSMADAAPPPGVPAAFHPRAAGPTPRRTASGWEGPNAAAAADPLARSLAHLLPGAQRAAVDRPPRLEDDPSISDFEDDDGETKESKESPSRPCIDDRRWKLVPPIDLAEKDAPRPPEADEPSTHNSEQRPSQSETTPAQQAAPAASRWTLHDVLHGLSPARHLTPQSVFPSKEAAADVDEEPQQHRRSHKRGIDTLMRHMDLDLETEMETEPYAPGGEVLDLLGLTPAAFERLPAHHKQRILQESRRKKRRGVALGKPFEPAGVVRSGAGGAARGTRLDGLRALLQSSLRRRQAGGESAALSGAAQKQLVKQHLENPTASGVEGYLLRAYDEWWVDAERFGGGAAPELVMPYNDTSAAAVRGVPTPALDGSGLRLCLRVNAVEDKFSLLRLSVVVKAVAREDLGEENVRVLNEMQRSAPLGELACFLPGSLGPWLAASATPGSDVYLAEPFWLFPPHGVIISSYCVTTAGVLQEDGAEAARRSAALAEGGGLHTPGTSRQRCPPPEGGRTPTPFRPSVFDPLRDADTLHQPGDQAGGAPSPTADSGADGNLDPIGAGFHRGPSPQWDVPVELLEAL